MASRARWCLHLAILLAYPLGLGALSWAGGEPEGPALPTTRGGLLLVAGVELLVFAAVFGAAWLASRADGRDLRLAWRGGLRPVLWGVVLSVALRVAAAAALFAVMLVAVLGGWASLDALAGLAPRTERMLDVGVLVDDGVYFALTVTLVSFVLAGLREELWRAGVLAGFARIWPEGLGTTTGQVVAAALAAVVFGIGHLTQGWGGVALTGAVGLGLGLVIVWRRSIWEAVLAHGFFDATSLVLLRLVAIHAPEALPGA